MFYKQVRIVIPEKTETCAHFLLLCKGEKPELVLQFDVTDINLQYRCACSLQQLGFRILHFGWEVALIPQTTFHRIASGSLQFHLREMNISSCGLYGIVQS